MPEKWNSRAFLPQRELQHRGNRLTLNPLPPADVDLDVPGRIPTDSGRILGVLEVMTVELVDVEGLQSTAIERPELVVVVDVHALDGSECRVTQC